MKTLRYKYFFFNENHFKIALHCLLNVFTLLSPVFNLKFIFKQKIDLKTCTFKILDKIQKTQKKVLKKVCQSCGKVLDSFLMYMSLREK